MPKILTVACSGTNFDESSGDLVATMAKRIKGSRYQDWLIFAGPGSEAITNHYYNPIEKPKDDSYLDVAKKAGSYAYDKGYYKVKGLAGGEGMALNSGFLIQFLGGLQKIDRPSVINMFGWSRGACTCVMMANAVSAWASDKSHEVEVNIFAIDPVPGPGNFVTEVLELPKCVKHCTVIHMENESRPAMIGAKIRAASKFDTALQHLSFPGNHSSGVTKGSSKDAPIRQLVAFHLYAFLIQRGTKLDVELTETQASKCEAYAEMILNQEHYLSLGSVNRLIADEKNYYELGHYLLEKRYFINDDHEGAFKSAYPDVRQRALSFDGSVDEKALASLDSSELVSEGTLRQRPKGSWKQWKEMAKDVRESLLQCNEIKALSSKLGTASKATQYNIVYWMNDTTYTKPVIRTMVNGKLKEKVE